LEENVEEQMGQEKFFVFFDIGGGWGRGGLGRGAEKGIPGIEVGIAVACVGDEGTVGGGESRTTESSSYETASSSPSRVSRKEDGE